MVAIVAKKKKVKPGPLGVWLRVARESKGLTRDQLAEVVGIHPVSLAKIENGTTQDPAFTVARRLADALGLSLADAPRDGGN